MIWVVVVCRFMLTDDDLAVWIAGLDDLFALVAGRVEPRRQAGAYVRGLLAPLASKNGWTLAGAAGDATPDGMRRLLNAAAWDVDGVRDDVRAAMDWPAGRPDAIEGALARRHLRDGGMALFDLSQLLGERQPL